MSYRDDDQDLLNTDDKGVQQARGVLSVLWRQLLVIRNIDGWKWDKLMKAYLADPHNGIQDTSRDRSSARGNLNKELKRDDMTWRVFLKAINFLAPVRVVFSVRITWADGNVNEVSARLKDRGVAMSTAPVEDPDDDLHTGAEPVDDIDGLTTTEYHPRMRVPQNGNKFSSDEVVEYMNSRNRR